MPSSEGEFAMCLLLTWGVHGDLVTAALKVEEERRQRRVGVHLSEQPSHSSTSN